MQAGLQDSVCEVAINYDVLQNRIGSICDKIYLTIFAKSKGALTWGEQFSIENGEREDTGYITTFPASILRMGLLSARRPDDVTAALLENNSEAQEYSISHIMAIVRVSQSYETQAYVKGTETL